MSSVARKRELFRAIRAHEMDVAASLLPPRARVLEIGGGSGYQAKLLSDKGFEVMSLDIDSRPVPEHEYHPVHLYDGVRVPADDGSFDAVFSSNVLEHVADLPTLLTDLRRVTKQGGVGVHLMPTPTWRFWTSVTYYDDLARRAASRLRRNPDTAGGRRATDGAVVETAGAGDGRPRLAQLMFPGPHGEFPSARAELVAFGRHAWLQRFTRAGFEVVSEKPNGLFYTGHLSASFLGMPERHALSRVLGSSCRAYVVR